MSLGGHLETPLGHPSAAPITLNGETIQILQNCSLSLRLKFHI